MRVTLKSVNEELARTGHNVELVKGGGYFFFRGGEADEWIDRAVRVLTISSLTLEQWVGEYNRLKAVNEQFTKATPQLPRAAKKLKEPPQEPAPPQPQSVGARDAISREPCNQKAKLLAELEQAHRDMAGIGEQQVRAAREGRFSDLVTLSESSIRERGKFDRALVAIRDHAAVHGC
jgi:hypothetical protein